MSNWTGQDWALLLGGAGVLLTALLTGIGSFITSMVTLYRLGLVAQKVDGMLTARDASNVAVGTLIGRAAGDDASAQRAEGRREQREIRSGQDAAAAALGSHSNDIAPVPVADEKVANITERGIIAQEKLAEVAIANSEATTNKPSPLSEKI